MPGRGQNFGNDHLYIYLSAVTEFCLRSCRGALRHCLAHGFDENGKKRLLLFFFFLLVPFPVLVFAQHVASLFIRNGVMEYLNTMILLAEGGLEAGPQLIFQIYFILSDAEKKPTPLHLLCLTSSFIIINKSSIELFLSSSLSSTELEQGVSLEGMLKDD